MAPTPSVIDFLGPVVVPGIDAPEEPDVENGAGHVLNVIDPVPFCNPTAFPPGVKLIVNAVFVPLALLASM
jgi:hypothetical protein